MEPTNIHGNYPDRRLNIIIFIILAVTIAATKFNILDLPYHWDEMGAYIRPTHWLADGSLVRAFPGFHPPHTFFGHPFALYLTLAAIYKIFGESIIVSHIFILVISLLGLFYTYLLGKYIHNTAVGFVSALLLLFSPIYFAQCGMVNGDTVITSLGVMTVYYFLKKSHVQFLICSSLLVLSKESSAAIIVALLIYRFFETRRNSATVKELYLCFTPLLVLTVFFLLQKITTGSFLPNQYFDSHSLFEFKMNGLSVMLLIKIKLKIAAKWLFLEQNRFIVLLLIIVHVLKNRRQAFKKEYVLFATMIIFFIAAYTLIFFLYRYLMPVLPYYFIMGAAAIVSLFSYRKLYYPVTLSVLICFMLQMHGHDEWGGSNEKDMQYRDVVLTHKDAGAYIERNFSDRRVLTVWPFTNTLTEPYLGYVTKSISVTENPKDNFDILVYTQQADKASADALGKVISDQRLRLQKVFYRNGKLTEIYRKPGPAGN